MANEFTDIHAQEEERARLEDKARQQRERDKGDLVWLMRDKRGRRFVRSVLDRAGVYRSSFSTNALQMAMNEGQRNAGLVLTADLVAHCPDMYFQMLKEHSEDE
jgi:hypothetical protein